MSASLITLILNIVLLVAVLAGFLIGVWRGAKKSGIRTLWLLGFLVVMVLVSPLISKAVVNIEISALDGTLGQYLATQIQNIPEIAEVYADNTALQDLVASLPVAIINLVVFMLLVPVAMLLSYFAYLINKAFLKGKKKNQIQEKVYTVQNGRPVVVENPKPKKYRIWGGVIGAVGGFVICLFMFLPINGTVHTLAQYINPAVASAQTEEKAFEYEEISNLITKNLGQEGIDIFNAVNSTVLSKISGVGNLDFVLYDAISSTTVDGQRVSLRKEINTIATVGETFLHVQNTTTEDGNIDWQNLDVDKLENTITTIFESGLVKLVGIELLQTYLDQAVNGTLLQDLVANNQIDEQTAGWIKEILTQIQVGIESDDGKLAKHLESDFMAVLGIAKSLIDSGLMGEITTQQTLTEKQWFTLVQSCLYGTHENAVQANHNYLADIIGHLFESNSLKSALVGAVNIGAGEAKGWLEQTLENQGVDLAQNPVQVDKITQTNLDWDIVAEDFLQIVEDLILAVDFALDNNLDTNFNAKTIIASENFEATALALADALDALQTMPLLTNTLAGESLLNQLLDEIARVDKFAKYADFTQLKDLCWQDEITPILQLTNFAKPAILAENIKTFAFKDMPYATLESNNTIAYLFDGALANAIKTDWITTHELYTGAPAQQKELLDILLENTSTLSDLSASALALGEAMTSVGKAGMFEVIVHGGTAENTNFTASALVEKTDGNTLLKTTLDTIFADAKLCKTFVWALNNMVIPTIEETANSMGKIDVSTPEKLAVWQAGIGELESALTTILEVYLDLEIETFDGLSGDLAGILKIVLDENFESTNAEKLGGALDELTTTITLCTTTNCQIAKQYLFNTLKTFEDINATAVLVADDTFWTTELTTLAPHLVLLNATFADNTQTTTLLDMLLSGQTEELVQTDGFKSLSTTQIEGLCTALSQSALFAPLALELANALQATLPI